MAVQRIQVTEIQAGYMLRVNQDTVVVVSEVTELSKGTLQIKDENGNAYTYGKSQKVYVIADAAIGVF